MRRLPRRAAVLKIRANSNTGYLTAFVETRTISKHYSFYFCLCDETGSIGIACMLHSRPNFHTDGMDAALSVESGCLSQKLRKPRQTQPALRRQVLPEKENGRQRKQQPERAPTTAGFSRNQRHPVILRILRLLSTFYRRTCTIGIASSLHAPLFAGCA